MIKKILSLVLFTITLFGFSNNNPKPDRDSIINSESTTIKYRKFKKLKHFSNYTKISKSFNEEFSSQYIAEKFPLDSVTNDNLTQAMGTMSKLDETQNYVDLLSPDDMVTLPVGVKKDIGNITYTMGISSAKFTPEYTEVTVFVRIIIPQLDEQGNQKQLFFGANNVKLSHQGGIYGEANLVLLGDIPIKLSSNKSLLILKGGFNMETGDIENQTYVTVDCGGFKELGITADVEFSRTLLEPVDTNYNILTNEDQKVTGSFETIVSDWNDVLVEINLPPFQLTKENSTDGTGKAGLIFELNTAVFDFSDIRNSESVVFPNEYQQYLIPGNEVLWRGVYVNSLKVVLPEQFQKKQSEERIVFEASNLLIDGMGVSGNFAVDNILPIDEGSASKWQFSVDHIEANIVTNNLTKAAFDGRIVLPINKELTKEEIARDSTQLKKKALAYGAIIDPVNDEYTLTVSSQDELSFNVFRAEATILPNSYIEMKVSESKFRPKAVLHGNLSISKEENTTSESSEKSPIEFNGIEFETLQLQTESPYFTVAYMGYKGDVTLGKFPVTISNIGVTATNNQASLSFGIDVNMMSGGFSGGTDLKIVGKFSEEEGLQRWKYDHIDVSRISIAADLGKIQIEGMVDLKNDDPVYGNGFYGELSATFNSIEVTATAWFGKTDHRYWYVDAYADLSGLPTPPTIGIVEVNGFGGGAYYGMSKKTNPAMQIYDGEEVVTPGPPSGTDYVPDADAGLGFRAMIGFALPKSDKAMNGKVGFEMAFNTHGGIDRILFFGEAHIVKALDFKFGDKFKDKLTKLENTVNSFGDNNSTMQSLKETNLVEYSKLAFPQDGLTFDVGIDANFSMEMDLENDSFHSEMEIYVNSPGNFFSGVGANGRAGWAVFHTGPDGWYLRAGTPEDRIGLRFGIGAASVESTSYLMIGDQIPSSPPPPAEVAEILGTDLDELDSMRDLNSLGEGRGFAFGADFSMDTGDLKFLMFYARLQAGLGFDIMIKDYGETACEGSGQIGVDGWYANGQAYAYLQGELGIHVKMFAINKKIPILEAGAAILMQAKLPNPSWFRGYVGGHYNVLGGLIKGKFRFKLELGTECEIVGGAPLGGLKIISTITPSENSGEVDVFAVPQVAFNMRVNEPFELEDDEGVKYYKILLKEYTIKKDGEVIAGRMEWNENNDMLNFYPEDVLPQNSTINLKVEVLFQEKNGSVWKTMTVDGNEATEIEEVSFTTGEAPDYIPVNNIEYCYPVIDQTNFYQDETNTGYVKLKQGQPYLFAPETDWGHKVVFESDVDNQLVTNISYNNTDKIVSFGIPNLVNSKTYTMSMYSYPPDQEQTISDGNQYTTINTGYEDNEVEILNKQAQSVVQEDIDVEMLSFDLTTSTHNTFRSKMQDKIASQYFRFPISTRVHYLVVDTNVSEPFSLLELVGSDLTENVPMITCESNLTDSYYQNTIRPLVYDHVSTQFSLDRDTSILGNIPKKAMTIFNWYQTNLENEVDDIFLKARLPFRYNLPKYYAQDYYDIRTKIVNEYLGDTERYKDEIEHYSNVITSNFPSIIKAEDYSIKMQYTLPGGQEGTSIDYLYVCPN